MSISIKVAIRCRPFTIDDKLGVKLRQTSDEEGEVELINCDYSTTRFPFTYAWWSAYGYKRHLTGDNMGDADNMALIDQPSVYEGCGQKIKADLFGGNAVVLFAYGLSGSGKTFTVFGPDAADVPEAWFKHAEPHSLWGILPRLAYEIFSEKQDGWKISMKYFQNVVDIVRDLMSPNGEEQHYKNGMRKDADGFMDIEWCSSKVINSWNEFREQFQIANQRKAIAPTQFNPMSTRGHCIMVLEVEMPHPETEGVKQRGRVYVCDLAGTEPAGDIVYAQYTKVTFDDGTFEYKFTGAHPDMKKTKELQDQGKKINLSLSEMAQFFMKMAEAVMKKKLAPGMTIPGCNSFFLCKYLKDTMLQARTYLFCAIRPEVQYLKYTFATLGFAKNASVVKLAPKKATVAASPAERKLMAELEAMKALVEQLKAAGALGSGGGGGGASNPDADRMISELQAKLAEKQGDLARQLGGSAESVDQEKDERQRKEYAKRGISLAALETENVQPYFINLDEDAFRSNRFMYILKQEMTVFGSKGDIQPPSLSVVKDHCVVKFDGSDIYIIGGKGESWHNGKPISAGTEVKLQIFDRVAMGDQLMLLRWRDHEDDLGSPMEAEDAVEEYQEGLINFRQAALEKASAAAAAAGGGGGAGNGGAEIMSEFEEERRKMQEERERWQQEKTEMGSKRNEEEYNRAMAAIDNAILDLLPKIKECKQTVDLLNRVTMKFDVVLEKGQDHIPKVKILVENSNPKLSILIDPAEFLSKSSLLKDEMVKLRSAIESGIEYHLPERHDPVYLFFDNDYLLGSATQFPEYVAYNLETDEEEKMQDIKNTAVPYNSVGLLEVEWMPLAGPNDDDEGKPIRDIESPTDLIGKSWTYKLKIKRAVSLPVFCEMAYISYDFFHETFVTEAVQQQTFSPEFDYTKIHHVPHVTAEFVEYLKGSIEFQVHVTQHINAPSDKIGTSNQICVESIKTGEPKGYEILGAAKPKSEAEVRCEKLEVQVLEYHNENLKLTNKVAELELMIAQLHGNPKTKKSIADAQMIDGLVNGVDGLH